MNDRFLTQADAKITLSGDDTAALALRLAQGEKAPQVGGTLPDARTLSDHTLQALAGLARQEGCCGSLKTFTGYPCRRHPHAAYSVCNKHGSRAPQTKAVADRALAAVRMPAITLIADEIERALGDECPTCGYAVHRNLKEKKYYTSLAIKVLDRTGLGPRATLELAPAAQDAFDVSTLTPEETRELDGYLNGIEELKSRVLARLAVASARQSVGLLTEGSTVIDAETVEDQ